MTFVKDPQETSDYGFDWSQELDSGETITTHAVTATSGLGITGETLGGTKVLYFAAGGEAGKRYDVTCHITTSAGRELDQTVRFLIVDL